MKIQVDSIRRLPQSLPEITDWQHKIVVVTQVTSLAPNLKWIKWFLNGNELWFVPDQAPDHFPVMIDNRDMGVSVVKAVDCFGNVASIQIDEEYLAELGCAR